MKHYIRPVKRRLAPLLLILILVLTAAGCARSSDGKGANADESGANGAGVTASDGTGNAATGTNGTGNAGSGSGGSAAQGSSDEKRLQIVTTIFPPYDFARAIAGGEADVKMLLKPGEEIHSYEPTPRDIMAIQNCDLFIYVGGENDVWADRILDNMGEKAPKTLRLVDMVDTFEEEVVEGMMAERGEYDHEDHDEAAEHSDAADADHDDHDEATEHSDAADADHDGHDEAAEHSDAADADHDDHEETGHDDHDETTDHSETVDAGHDHEETDHDGHGVPGGDSSHEEHEEADEHVWTSPRNAAQITAKTAEEMCALDPARALYFDQNAKAYEAEIMAVDREFWEIADAAERTTIVFGDRFPIRYFAEEYGLSYYAAFPGCSAQSEPSAATLVFLIEKVQEERIPVVFSIEFSSGNIARAICESTGAAQRTFHSCHNVTRDEFERGETYVSLMRGNLDAVREALCGELEE